MPIPAGSGPPPPPTSGPIVYDPQLSRVRLAVPGVSSATGQVRVERSTDLIRWSTVRGGATVPVVGGVARVDDYEFSPDVLNHYRVVAPTVMNPNPYFEVDAAGWTGLGGTAVRSTAQAHEGVASLLGTPDGVSSTFRVESELCPVVPGKVYRPAAWVRSTGDVEINAAWFTGAGVFLDIFATAKPVAAATWTQLAAEYTAPAGAGQVRLQVRLTGTPPAGRTVSVDEAVLTGPDGVSLYEGSIAPQIDRVWLKSMSRPFLNLQVTVRDFSEVTRRSRAGVFDVVGRSLPVAVTDVRSSRQWTLDVSTYTERERSDLDLLLASGDILLVHVPTGAGRISAVPGGYVTVGDTREATPPTFDLAMRVFSLPFTEVAAPGPDVVGATVTCQGVLNAYPTCQAVLDAHPTCLSLLELIGAPEDVIVG